jgi:hypothetical protein
MKAKAVVGCVIVAAAVSTPQAMASEAVPLKTREGVVVAWQAKSKTAVVVMSNQKVLVIHSLRRYRVGRWVRVRGVKWGSRVSGVKWGYRPWGVKWAIPMAKNGTYRSSLTDLGFVRHTMSLRAAVLYRNKRRMVVSVPGASWVIRFGRRAVWLPGPKLVNSTTPNGFGMKVKMQLKLAADGSVEITKVAQVRRPTVGAIIPVAGTVRSRNSATRQLSVAAGGPSGVVVTVTVPTGVDLGMYPVGSEVSGTVMAGSAETEPILTGISRNGSFPAADTAATTIGAAVPPGPDSVVPGNNESTLGGGGATPNVPSDDGLTQSQLDDIAQIRAGWDAAAAGTPPLVTSQGLYTGQAELLSFVNDSIAARKRTLAVLQLVAFELVVGAQKERAIDSAYKAAVIGQTTALRIKLLSSL